MGNPQINKCKPREGGRRGEGTHWSSSRRLRRARTDRSLAANSAARPRVPAIMSSSTSCVPGSRSERLLFCALTSTSALPSLRTFFRGVAAPLTKHAVRARALPLPSGSTSARRMAASRRGRHATQQGGGGSCQSAAHASGRTSSTAAPSDVGVPCHASLRGSGRHESGGV